ncbi:uncharacterized protein LOC144880986 isoform X2 [Branchiostoma floridae x Branchiostoma japonicum]
MPREQKRSQTDDTEGGTTPMQQAQTNWKSCADEAANIPNPLYGSRAGASYEAETNNKTKCWSLCKKVLETFLVVVVCLLLPYCAVKITINSTEVTNLAVEMGKLSEEVAELSNETEIWFKMAKKQEKGAMGPAGPGTVGPVGNGTMGPKGPAGPPCLPAAGSSVCRAGSSEHPQTFIKGEANPVSCPKGHAKWRGMCFKPPKPFDFKLQKNFSEATATCRQDGGTLAMPRDAETNAFLSTLHHALMPGWIGLHDRNTEGNFEWIDGTELGTYSCWAPVQPDNADGQEDCVFSDSRGLWFDSPCSSKKAFACQYPGRTRG